MGRSLSIARLKAEADPIRLKAKEELQGLMAMVTRRSRGKDEVNTSLMKQLQTAPSDTTFVLDSNVACIFKRLEMDRLMSTPHRQMFLDFLLSVKLAAPPAAAREYRAFGSRCAIPLSKMPRKDELVLEAVAEDIIALAKRSPRARWLASKECHGRRAADYKLVLQCAMIYPRSVILSNDWDLWIFGILRDEIEALIARKHPTLFGLNLGSVSMVHVAAQLGLAVR